MSIFGEKKVETTGADARAAQMPKEVELPSNRDFAHCDGGHCPLKRNCVRHLALLSPNPNASTKGLSVMGTIPVESGKCSFYWPLSE